MWYPVWCDFARKEEPMEHWHFGTEFIYLTEGVSEITVADKKYTVSAGQVFMIHRVACHVTDRTSEAYGRYCLIVQADELHKYPMGIRLLTHLTNSSPDSACLIDVGEDRDEILRIYKTLEREWNSTEPYSVEYLMSVVEQFLALLCRHCDEGKANLPDERMFRVREEIDRDFATEITVPELARRHFISEDHLIHEFKRVVGTSPGQYIIMNRLIYARELLITTDESLGAIAQRAGFGDVNNFIRSFKKHFGMPPGKWRKMLNNAPNA